MSCVVSLNLVVIIVLVYFISAASSEMSYADVANPLPVESKSESPHSASPSMSRRERIPFFSGIPSVDVIKGVLHLYKPKLVL